jgi:hypothetical protein
MAVLPTVEVPDRLAAAVRAMLAERSTTYASLIRELLRGELAGAHRQVALDELTVHALAEALLAKLGELHREAPVCIVCGMPRRTDHPDPMHDSMAHAQCAAIMANLGRELESK